MPNYLTMNKSITEMNPQERMDLVRRLRHLREMSKAPQTKTRAKKVQKKKDAKSLVEGLSLDELLKMQAALEEKG